MNGSRVRGGEGRFITFYFIIFYTTLYHILLVTNIINHIDALFFFYISEHKKLLEP